MCSAHNSILMVILVIPLICTITSSKRNNYCKQDLSEAMFKSDLVILAKVKDIAAKSDETVLTVRLSKVIKVRDKTSMKGLKKVKIYHPNKLCRKIKEKRKYIFCLSLSKEGRWQADCSPTSASKKVKRIMQHLFCEQCGKGPTLKSVPDVMNVKINRWRNIKCRLTSGQEPKVSFDWFHNGQRIQKGLHFKIKTRRVLDSKGNCQYHYV